MLKKIKALSWKKKVLFGCIILVVLLIVRRVIIGNKPNYTFDTVSRGTITEVVTETGNVAVSGEYDVPSPSTGLLSAIYVQNGASVSAGQKLFQVTSTATPQQKETALAAYLAAKSQLDAANAQLFSLQSVMFSAWKVYTDIAENSTYQNPDSSPNSSNRTLTPFTTVQDNWLSAEANYKNQQSVIASAQAGSTNAYTAYLATQDSVVTAPVAGTIHNLDGVVGTLVNAPSAGVVPSPVAIISTGEALTVKAPVNEVDINKIKVGDTATITFDAILDKTFTGKIIQADEYGTNVAGVINYNIFSSVDDGTELIKPGMTANLSIDTNKHENVLTVVNAAIRPYQGVKAIQTLDKKGKPTYVKVTTGIKGADRTELITGATQGEKVILGGPAPTIKP
jgi:multidrug efflux pump subunit AcrA (membrane-fusion protein)